jgi:cytochrome P450
MAAAARPPGQKGSLLLGNLREFARDNLRFFQRQIREHGDVVGGRFFNRRFVVLGHPDLVEQVLLVQHKNFVKHSFFWRHVTALFGRGLLVSEGDFWLRQRRLAAPAFHGKRIAAYADVMVELTERMVDGWRAGETRDAHAEMMRVTMQIVAKTLFDAEVRSRVPSTTSSRRSRCASASRCPSPTGCRSRATAATWPRCGSSTAWSTASSPSTAPIRATAATCCRCCSRRATTTAPG